MSANTYNAKVSEQGGILRGRIPTPMIVALGAQDQDVLVFTITGPGTLEVYNNGPGEPKTAAAPRARKAATTAAPAPVAAPSGQPPRRRATAAAPVAAVPSTLAPQPVAAPSGQPPRRKAAPAPVAAEAPAPRAASKRSGSKKASASSGYSVPGFD